MTAALRRARRGFQIVVVAPLRRRGQALRSAWLRTAGGRAAAAARGRTILHCLGDSHVGIFREVARLGFVPGTWFDVIAVKGATAMGLVNPLSSTNALPTFRRAIDRVPPDEPLLLMLGEVDCGFVIWYRAETRGLTVAEQFEDSLAKYTSFLETLLAEGRRVVVSVVPPPTIPDEHVQGEVAVKRLAVTATIAERTELTRSYNERLRAWAAERGCVVLDFEADVLDSSTGLVADTVRNPDPRDHHLDPARFAGILAARLRELGFA